ncbi:hypothetical protein L1987_55444 [Smallanthus sonchifolius]|uniref:Uncharacterized protein n=1 Tax=Smallanthus sonchifolius TaxID=185202 RepID=A0ACB9E9M4_9ASTR|nr:hypothetical protein L1987_55444 [Smallanthus sonchifolius]
MDVKNQPLDQWNIKPPPLSLWSRSDWTAKHVEVAEKHGHIEKKQTTPHQEALRAVSDYLMEENHDCFGDFSNIMTDYPDITTLLDDVPEEETDATQLNCETINMTSDTLDDLVNMDLSSPISSSNNTRSDPIRLSPPCIQPGPHPGFSPPHYANTNDPYGPGAQFVYPQPGHYATNYDYPNYSYPGSSSNNGQY